MKEKKGNAATRAKQKYNAANYDRLYPYVPKGRKSVYEAAAKAVGMSLNDFVTRAIEEKIEREGLESQK
ncbi:hypothetical protein J6TS7_65410 [Paenibacillus dendritiformis]|uniref:transcriptional regulator n=1 Tax=Paenibacillus TaxID=44249 RepID=UPI001B2F83DB|nr:transcriptional regulator [Paenibacillus dendritiformis]GIO82931.1 hypothetical protein J6TS7_65410 [Paenibacillus dendritiformis]